MGTKKTFRITYIIPAYNSSDVIVDAVESIVGTNLASGDEIIIVDDCSKDNTIQVVEKLSKKISSIRLIMHKVNRGLGIAAINTAIEHSDNELFFCLDHDNVLAPNSMQTLLDYLIKNSADIASFQELRYFINGTAPTNTTHKWVFKDGIVTLADALAGPIWPGPSGNYLFTRGSWLKAGRCNEFAHPAIDCWAFGIQQLATGAKMVVLPGSFYYHRYGHNSQWVENSEKGNVSLATLEVLLRYYELIERCDLNYIMSEERRMNWFMNIEKHPLKIRGMKAGVTGYVDYLENNQYAVTSTNIFRKILRRIIN